MCSVARRVRFHCKVMGCVQGHRRVARIVNTLLQLMEEYDVRRACWSATTNVESSLDDALFRRFDDVFQVPLPGPVRLRSC